jgi:hypothetical protein
MDNNEIALVQPSHLFNKHGLKVLFEPPELDTP